MVTLQNCELFRPLTPAELKTLRGLAVERAFPAGHEIFREGDAGDGLYVVGSGLVEISVVVGQGSRHVFSEVKPGEMFGEMAVVESQPRSATAAAKQDTVAYFVPRDGMLDLVVRSPALALALLGEISHRLREFNRQYLREVLQTERLAIIGRFSRSIIHDLKNPLNVIGLTAEMAAMEHASPEARRVAAADIRKQIERISDLIGEILEFTRGPQKDFVLAPMDYAGFVEHVLGELRPEAALKSATLAVENPPPAVALQINPLRLRRVFFNLVHNATDAMPEGGRILLRFTVTPGEVVTEIEDTGPGVAPEIAGQLFQPFATHGKAHGTGLGLSICRRIVEDHRGWIAARSPRGHGAIFAFGLPRPGASPPP